MGGNTNMQSITDLLCRFAELEVHGHSQLSSYTPSTQMTCNCDGRHSCHLPLLTGALLGGLPHLVSLLGQSGGGVLDTYLALGTALGKS